jgi:hypothetical protein
LQFPQHVIMRDPFFDHRQMIPLEIPQIGVAQ